jgi:hypothetical protein
MRGRNTMKQSIKILPLILIVIIILAGCDAIPQLEASNQLEGDVSGAQTWIEFPRDGQVLPNVETAFVVYSTAAEGAGNIVLKLDGAILPAGTTDSLSTDGSRKMVRLDQKWTPPREGEFTLQAASGSGSSEIKFCIVSCDPEKEPEADKVDTPTASPTAEVSDTPEQATVTLTTTATPTIMPSATATWKPTWTPTIKPTFTEAPPQDAAGPSVNSVGVFWEGCSLYGTANLTDPSGVIWAEFWFNHNEEGWAWILMNQNGDQWVSQVGVDTGGFAGSMEYKVRTEDSLNNESWSGVFTKNYAYCGE